jgi:hypothetical protein
MDVVLDDRTRLFIGHLFAAPEEKPNMDLGSGPRSE